MVNNIPVNGWPQLKDLEAVQPILNRLDKIEAWKRTVKEETFTGDDITIENALALPARSLITEINAIQDLHGYDKPWAGGADRNLLPDTYTAQSASVFGLTVTKVDNGLRFVGVPNWNTQTSQFRAASSSDIATLYADGASSACFLKASNQYINIDSCRVDGNDIIVVANTTATTTSIDFTLEFMMYKGTAPTAFRPYSNICPIGGRSSAVITLSDGDEISEDFTIQLGTTVYGADINWDTGVMTVKTAILVKNTADMDNSEDYPGWKESGIRALVGGGINRIITGINTNCGTAYGVNTTGVSGDTVLLPKDYYGGKTQTEWIALAMDIQIPVTLATPTTIQFTPTQLEMLKGYNRITLSDGYGTIEIKALTGANWS